MSGQHNQRNNNLRDRPRQRRREDSPTVALSKQLSWLLRHGLEQSGLQVRTDGYVSLTELVFHSRIFILQRLIL
jgi:RNA:NAD 2'-phosphotransferase (TPT1/KptA family)